MNKIKFLTALGISLLPLNYLRVNAYKTIFRYNILSSRIGFRTIILVEYLELINCKIDSYNTFIGPMRITIEDGARIGSYNTFNCPDWSASKDNLDANYERKLIVERNAMITNNHYLDIAGLFVLGENSWIAGMGSQFWTHGAGIKDRNIKIGNDCYIGSAVRLSPGSTLGNNIIVGMGFFAYLS